VFSVFVRGLGDGDKLLKVYPLLVCQIDKIGSVSSPSCVGFRPGIAMKRTKEDTVETNVSVAKSHVTILPSKFSQPFPPYRSVPSRYGF